MSFARTRIVAVAGAVLATGADLAVSTSAVAGDLLAVGGGIAAAVYTTYGERARARAHAEEDYRVYVDRRDTLRASKTMQERAFADPKISFAWNSEVAEIHERGGKLAGLTLRDTVTGETSELAATGLFVAIGHDPRTELVTGQVDLDDEGYLKVASPSTRTNIPGVFGAGDVVDHTYRQAITAAGSGCAAALDAERYLAALSDAEAAGEPAVAAV